MSGRKGRAVRTSVGESRVSVGESRTSVGESCQVSRGRGAWVRALGVVAGGVLVGALAGCRGDGGAIPPPPVGVPQAPLRGEDGKPIDPAVLAARMQAHADQIAKAPRTGVETPRISDAPTAEDANNTGGSPGNTGGLPGNTGVAPGNAGGAPGNPGGAPNNAAGPSAGGAAPSGAGNGVSVTGTGVSVPDAGGGSASGAAGVSVGAAGPSAGAAGVSVGPAPRAGSGGAERLAPGTIEVSPAGVGSDARAGTQGGAVVGGGGGGTVTEQSWSRRTVEVTGGNAGAVRIDGTGAGALGASQGSTAAGVGAGGGVESAVRERVARDARDVSAALDLQLLEYLRGGAVPDAGQLAALPQEDRELVAAVVDALVNFRAGVRADPNAPYAAKARPLAEMGDRLRVRSDLVVPVVQLCSEIRGFGLYEPVPAVLATRGENAFKLYYEVANFTSRLGERRMWETRLGQQLTLYDDKGRVVWQARQETLTDLCRNRRSDFYVAANLRLPGVPAGRYSLKLTLTDLNAGRVAEGVLPLEAK